MQFPDKLSSIGEPEQYATGEKTERFVILSETREEYEAVSASLANLAFMVLQSEATLDSEDARTLLDFIRLDRYQQARLTVHAEQAERLARLIRLGAGSAMPDILDNQFASHASENTTQTDDETLTRLAVNAADSLSVEAGARAFRKELDDDSLNGLFGFTDEG